VIIHAAEFQCSIIIYIIYILTTIVVYNRGIVVLDMDQPDTTPIVHTGKNYYSENLVVKYPI